MRLIVFLKRITGKILLQQARSYRYSIFPVVFYNHYRHFFHHEGVCYLKIPKVACTSILHTFARQQTKDFNDIHFMYDTLLTKAHSYNEIKNLFKFTFIRNPFDRLYSCFKDKIANKSHSPNKAFGNVKFLSKKFQTIEIYTNDTFENFVKKTSKIYDTFSDEHFVSQYHIMHRNKKCLVDKIGKFENLAEGFEPIRQKYGLRKLIHTNVSQSHRDEWKNHYTKELAALVYKRYRKDFDLWYPNAYAELLNYLDKK